MKANGELAMQVNLPPDLETLVNKRLSSGGYASVEDVFRRAQKRSSERVAKKTVMPIT